MLNAKWRYQLQEAEIQTESAYIDAYEALDTIEDNDWYESYAETLLEALAEVERCLVSERLMWEWWSSEQRRYEHALDALDLAIGIAKRMDSKAGIERVKNFLNQSYNEWE